MKYSSVYDYLDKHLKEHPTDADIKKCKQDYWKWYKSQHRKERVQKYKILHLTISKKVWQKLNTKAKQYGIDVYTYIKHHLRHGVDTTLEMDRMSMVHIMQSTQLIQDYLQGDINLEDLLYALEKMILKA